MFWIYVNQDAGYGEKNMCASDDDNEEENQKIDDEVYLFD